MKLRINESDDKITAKSFQELISKLEDHGYSCEHYYDTKYPESNWLYITKNGDPYEAEFYKYRDGEYELYLHNIHPTKRKNESKKRINGMKENLYRVWYRPYNYPGEEDFMEVTAKDEESAREFVRTNGSVTDVQEIDHKIDPYDECLTTEDLCLENKYGTLADYLERHLDSWYGRLNEIGEDIEELGLDVDEINDEYIVVHATEPDGEDAYCKIRLGGTERTISLETFEMLESVRRSKKSISESYYSYDNLRISEILDKIEQTNNQRKIDRAYDFIGHACDNIDACMETGFYDLSDASWGYETDYIIEELTNILNESIK